MRVSVTSRTAVYGPVRTVVWEGRSREAPPYPDLWHLSDLPIDIEHVCLSGRPEVIGARSERARHRGERVWA